MRAFLHSFRESRLSLRLLGYILVVSIVLTLLSSGLQLLFEYRRNVTAIHERLANIEASYSAALANSLWSFDEDQVQIQLRSMLQLPSVEYAEVQTNYGDRYSAGTPRTGDDVVSRTFELRYMNGEVVPLGRVTLQATLRGVRQYLAERTLVIFATEAITTFLIALFIFFIFQRMVTRHLGTMASFARTMRLDRLDQPLTLHREPSGHLRPDELDQVSRSINDMRHSLQAEICDRRKAEAATRFLADAGKQLSISLDYQAVADEICRLAVSEFGDMAVCFASHVDSMYAPVSSIAAHVPEHLDALREALRHHPAGLELRPGEIVPDVTRELDRFHPTPEQRRTVEELRVRSFAAVPLELHGRDLGVLVMMTRRDGARTLHPEDRSLIDEFGRRAATALDNALLYQEAQNAIRLRDEFLTVASHELKTPLMTLRLQAYKLERLGESKLSDEALRESTQKSGAALDRQVERLKQLVDAILDVSQIVAGSLELRRQPIDLAELARDMVDRLSGPRQAASNITVEVTGDATGLWDPIRLRQVVISLLSNAMKFGAGRPIEIHIASQQDVARLSVTDHGIGIPKEDQKRIFERFTRAVSERHFGGLGLGLFVSRKIVEAHGGTIRVESEPGQGATFIVELPLNLPPPLTVERPAPGTLLH